MAAERAAPHAQAGMPGATGRRGAAWREDMRVLLGRRACVCGPGERGKPRACHGLDGNSPELSHERFSAFALSILRSCHREAAFAAAAIQVP